jgi:hypothetical protein
VDYNYIDRFGGLHNVGDDELSSFGT